jgi:hypothetical protein
MWKSDTRQKLQPGRLSIAAGHAPEERYPKRDAFGTQMYNLWSSTDVGHVLAAMLDLQLIEPHVELTRNLQRCLDESEGATREYLASLAGAAGCALTHWVSVRLKPALDHLCRPSYRLKLPLLDLFAGVPASGAVPSALDRKSTRGAAPVGRSQ